MSIATVAALAVLAGAACGGGDTSADTPVDTAAEAVEPHRSGAGDDPAAPEALVYELDSAGDVVGLDLHEHSTLPLWVLHAWIWKDNPAGTFEDFNPAVRSCPDGVPVFGVDLP